MADGIEGCMDTNDQFPTAADAISLAPHAYLWSCLCCRKEPERLFLESKHRSRLAESKLLRRRVCCATSPHMHLSAAQAQGYH